MQGMVSIKPAQKQRAGARTGNQPFARSGSRDSRITNHESPITNHESRITNHSITNFPNATPKSQPLPVPASASETSPLVMTWALLDFTAPAWASAVT